MSKAELVEMAKSRITQLEEIMLPSDGEAEEGKYVTDENIEEAENEVDEGLNEAEEMKRLKMMLSEFGRRM